MLRFAADENLSADIVRGLLRRCASIDIVSVRDIGLSGADDPQVLNWAAAEGRVLITHDRRTMPLYAQQRVESGRPMPGMFVISQTASAGHAIEELLLLWECSTDADWDKMVIYLPL